MSLCTCGHQQNEHVSSNFECSFMTCGCLLFKAATRPPACMARLANAAGLWSCARASGHDDKHMSAQGVVWSDSPEPAADSPQPFALPTVEKPPDWIANAESLLAKMNIVRDDLVRRLGEHEEREKAREAKAAAQTLPPGAFVCWQTIDARGGTSQQHVTLAWLRELYATSALTGAMATSEGPEVLTEDLVKYAYDVADAMLQERERRLAGGR